ncbi:MAG: VPLPA-CTERM sorting domain-containing protein [Cycloclasticus sp.]
MNRKILTLAILALLPLSSYAASIDGSITPDEYQWSTDGQEGADKWETFGRGGRANNEYNDASGGNKWDINYLGTSVADGQFQFGAIGGKILSGRKTGSSSVTGEGIFLSDFALGFNTLSDPTLDSSGFDYAIRLVGVNNNTGEATFKLLSGGTWAGADIYNGIYEKNKTATYKMVGATDVQQFTGKWARNGEDDNVLEASFDLNWLSLFDLDKGGRLSTYLTMACVNDEVMVHADIAPVPLPAAVWLLSPALIGFMGYRRRLKS